MTGEGREACSDRERLPGLVNGHLSDEAATRLQAHVAACPACRAELALYQRLTTTLRDLPPLAAPLGLRERIVAASHTPENCLPSGASQRPSRRPLILRRLAPLLALVIAVGLWGAVTWGSRRYQGRTADDWQQAARSTAERAYLLHVVGWVKRPTGIVPVEAWRLAGTLTTRVGSRTTVIRGAGDGPRLLLATWGGAAPGFSYGESLLFIDGSMAPANGPPRIDSRVPLIVAVPRAGGLVQRVWIDPVSQQVRRVQLIGRDDQPVAALERLEYNPFSALRGG